MKQYSYEQKRNIVTEYLTGENGYTNLAKKYHINKKTIRIWVNQYQQYGEEALQQKPKGRSYSSNFKQEVINYRKMTGASQLETANHFGLLYPTLVGHWEQQTRNGSQKRGRPTMLRNRKKPTDLSKLSRKELEKEIELLNIEVDVLKKLKAFRENANHPEKNKPKS